MSVKIIAQLHPFSSEKLERAVDPQSIRSILSQIISGCSESCVRVMIDDEIITDFDRVPMNGQTVYIKIIPEGDGSPKSTGKGMTWGGIGLIVAGLVVTIASAGTLAGLGVSLIGTGIGMTASGVVLMNTDIDISGSSSSQSPDQDPSIKGSKNRENQWGYIPVVFGRHLLYPDQAATPYTIVEGNSQWVTHLYCLGYRDIELETETFKIGDTALVDYSASKNLATILSGNDSAIKIEILTDGTPSALYPKVCHELALNQILKHLYDDGTDGAIIRTTSLATEVNVDIFFYNGLGKYTDSGEIGSASVVVQAYIKRDDEDDSTYESLGFFNGSTNIIEGSELKTKRYQITKTGLTLAKYTIKIMRVTPDNSSSKIVDAVYIGSIRAFTDDRPVSQERANGLAFVSLKAKATDRLNGAIDEFNLIVQSKLPVYSGIGNGPAAWITSATTRNPASMMLYALQGRITSEPVSIDHLDWAALEEWYIWCESHSYYCDAVLSDKKTFTELTKAIAQTARAELVKIDSMFTVIQDKVKSVPTQLFTPKNTIGYSQTISFAVIPDALEMDFINADADFQDDERVVYNTDDGEEGEDDPATKQTVSLWGVTNSRQAFLIGRYNYGCIKLRPRIHKIDIDIEYLMSNKGDRIKYAGDTALSGIAYGRIRSLTVSSGYITQMYLDETVDIEAGIAYAIRIRAKDASLHIYDISATEGLTNCLSLVTPIEETSGINEKDLYTFGKKGYEDLDLIITSLDPVDDWTASLTCVDYSPGIFGIDEQGYIIPDFTSKIQTGNVVDSGAIEPQDWKTFQTYHDSTEEPSAPTGDGTENGWHRSITTGSNWVSSKVAKTASDGIWGAPIQTTSLVTSETETKLSTRPTYDEIAKGFEGSGLVLTPSTPTVSAVGGLRFITLTWSKQANLSNLREYQIQVSEDSLSWYAPSLDGMGVNGHGSTENAFLPWTTSMLVHANIPPSGTTEIPTGRMLYYRVRQLTALGAVSDWSAVVAATTKLADTGDYAAHSISANSLNTAELFALFATLSETLIIDPNAGIAAQKADYSDGDTRAVLNAKELLFQYVLNGSWSTIVRLALEGLRATQIYSQDHLVITNATMKERRSKGCDIGRPYLSNASRVTHYDSDMLDNMGADYFTVSGSGVLVGKDEGIDPAVVAVAPYATEAKSLYGQVHLAKELGVVSTYTVDLWVMYYYNENQQIIRIGSDIEYVAIEVLNTEPYYCEDDGVQYIDSATDGVWYNEARGAIARIVYFYKGFETIKYINDSNGNVLLGPNKWYHIGIIESGNTLSVVIGTKVYSFTSPPDRQESLILHINPGQGSILIDEIIVDPTTAESTSDFITNTSEKKPWAKLSDTNKWLIIQAQDPNSIETNLWECPGFKTAVQSIIDSQ